MPRALTAALCLAAAPALAFEGVIDTRMTVNTGKMDDSGGPKTITGKGSITIKGLNTRMDQEMTMPGITGPVKQTVIHRSDEPNTTYMLHDSNKTYSKMTSDPSEREQADTSKWTVKRLGKDTVAGRSTEHVLVNREGKEEATEVWIDRNLVSAGDLEKAIAQGERSGGWWMALKKEGVAGVPLKVVTKSGKGEGTMTWEATSVKSQSVPDSAFKVPAGYTEGKSGFGGGTLTPAQQQEMKNKMMEHLTPEQRQKMEEMMKQHGGGK